MIRGFGYAIKQAFTQIFRNRTMTIASVFSITAMMMILGLFFMMAVNVNMMAEDAKKQFDTIEIYLLDATDQASADTMIQKLKAMPDVKSADFITKDQAMQEFKVSWGDNAYLLDTLGSNPLPNSIRVKVDNLEGADQVVSAAKNFQGVENVRYYQDTVRTLLRITNFVRIGALVVIAFLVVVSIVVVSNTIKLTVLARSREIGIMKYIGATNWFIRGPFLAEGILIGVISAGVSLGLVSLIYSKVTDLLGDNFAMFTNSIVPLGFLIFNTIWIFLALGISIGAIGSILSMRRFLDT